MTPRIDRPTRAGAAAEHADAVLREMRARLKRLEDEVNTHVPGLTDAESDARVDAGTDKCLDVEDQIAAHPAGTNEGLLIKVRLLVHLALPQKKLIDGRLMLGILADTERLAKAAGRETREKRKLPKPSRRRSRRG